MSIDYNKIEETLARLEAAQAVPKGDPDSPQKLSRAEYEAMMAILPLMHRVRKLDLLRIQIGSGEIRSVDFVHYGVNAYIILREMTRPRR